MGATDVKPTITIFTLNVITHGFRMVPALASWTTICNVIQVRNWNDMDYKFTKMTLNPFVGVYQPIKPIEAKQPSICHYPQAPRRIPLLSRYLGHTMKPDIIKRFVFQTGCILQVLVHTIPFIKVIFVFRIVQWIQDIDSSRKDVYND